MLPLACTFRPLKLAPRARESGFAMTSLRLRSALRLPWYVVLLVATYCLLHLGLAVEHPCATQGSTPD